MVSHAEESVEVGKEPILTVLCILHEAFFVTYPCFPHIFQVKILPTLIEVVVECQRILFIELLCPRLSLTQKPEFALQRWWSILLRLYSTQRYVPRLDARKRMKIYVIGIWSITILSHQLNIIFSFQKVHASTIGLCQLQNVYRVNNEIYHNKENTTKINEVAIQNTFKMSLRRPKIIPKYISRIRDDILLAHHFMENNIRKSFTFSTHSFLRCHNRKLIRRTKTRMRSNSFS